jgi:hypothetical protein
MLLNVNKMINNPISRMTIGGFPCILNMAYVMMIYLSHLLIALLLYLPGNAPFFRYVLKQQQWLSFVS